MRSPALRRQRSALSRMLPSTGSPHAGRGLGDMVTGVVHGVSGVVHDFSGVAHDVGHAVDDAISGQLSKLPEDIVKTTLDVAKTGKDVAEVIHGPTNSSSGHDTGGAGAGSNDPNASGGGDGAPQPRPPPNAGSGGGEGAAPHPSPPDSSHAPSSTAPLPSSMSPSSEYTAPASSAASNTGAGAANVVSYPPYVRPPTEPMDPPAKTGAGREDSQPTYVQMLSSATPSSTTMHALPSYGSGAAAAHRKGFPLAAAAAIGSILRFVVVSLLFWAVWLYLRKRRRVYLPPKRMLSVTSGRTVSTVPLFISASEARVKDENPFKHPRDTQEDDPFDAASLWRSSTARSASTLSA